ncbi:calcitonin gene-related peptide type 1 receptor-like isoform X2 [Lineus longissimus]|uniref:calcitonin gene-related peptide type 1 receptor-like isoform X2 n=1 Tax=Lineus longissimus TaxID=88925 RepID=UPI00315D1728
MGTASAYWAYTVALSLIMLPKDTLSAQRINSFSCSDRDGTFTEEIFKLRSCATCFTYLFRNRNDVVRTGPFGHLLNRTKHKVTNDRVEYLGYELHYPDITNSSTITALCDTLSTNDCQRWRQCCQAGQECCHHQQASPSGTIGTACRSTWDGWLCWDEMPPGTEFQYCPDYVLEGVERLIGSAQAVKTCTPNGTWLKKNGREWTNFKTCLAYDAYLVGVYVNLGTNILSIMLLVPAIIIFISYRQWNSSSFHSIPRPTRTKKTSKVILFLSDPFWTLRRQHRVKVHTNFFFSLLLCAICAVIWEMLIKHDRLITQDYTKTRMHQNSAGCQVLSALKIYFSSTNYFWMFCEGYYLHRLLSDAFRPPENLVPLYLIGWGIPAVPVIIYSIIRVLYANESCWVLSYRQWNWLYYVPNMLCLGVNLCFLCNILRVITSRLQSHPNEPSNFRKGLKAVFILIPLFGLQLFVTIYRPPNGSPGLRQYDTFHYFITNSQGFFVALIFCFFNQEVMNHLKMSCRYCCRRRGYRRPSRHHSYATSITTDGGSRTSPRVSLRLSRRSCNMDSPSRSPFLPKDTQPTWNSHTNNYTFKNGSGKKKDMYVTIPTETQPRDLTTV